MKDNHSINELNKMKNALFVYTKWNKFPKGLYPRNRQILRMLKEDCQKIDVISINAPKGTIQTFIANIKLAIKLMTKCFKKYDIVVVGHENLLFSMMITRYLTLSNFYVKEFLFSKWYTFVKDYKHKLNPIVKWLLKKSDQSDIANTDFVMVDTEAHLDMLKKYFLLLNKKNTILEYVHTDYDLFDPHKISKKHIQFKNRVFFHGGYIPLQGTPIITRALSELPQIEGIMIGRGHEFSKAIKAYKPIKDNTQFIDYVNYNVLPEHIYEAEVCLGGPFGNSEKAKAVITNKTFEYLAMNKKTIVGNTPANKELLKLFPEKKHLIYYCKLNDHIALKNTIIKAMRG